MQQSIRIRGARTNNLKGIDVDIPYEELVVITGPSGSGKTSLGFGTLFAEGSLRYIKSFSAHARQFLDKINHPPVKSIQGILPSVGLTRKGSIENPRAKVGTSTDIYSYIKLFYTHLGTTYSPISGQPVKKDTIQDVVDYLKQAEHGSKAIIASALEIPPKRTWKEALEVELSKGFIRIIYKNQVCFIEDVLNKPTPKPKEKTYIIVDLIKCRSFDKQLYSRIADSAKTAFYEGKGTCLVQVGEARKIFSDRFEADGITFQVPSVHFFSFNSNQGACNQCRGPGQYWGLDRTKVIPNTALSIEEGAIIPWENTTFAREKQTFLTNTKLPIYRPYKDFTAAQQKTLWEGNKHVEGINRFFEKLAAQKDKIQNRIIHAHYQGFITCQLCCGTGLREEVKYVKVNGRSIIDLLAMPIDELYDFFQNVEVAAHQKKVADVLLEEINNRLFYLKKVGLGYISLLRKMNSLSGGEYQRARLAKILGSPLIDTMYVLDEPTTGLHKRDAAKLVATLIDLKKVGNTVIVVGHEELMMRAASTIIDIGPEGGIKGGELIFQGNWQQLRQLKKEKKSYTADYLSGKRKIPIPQQRKKPTGHITLQNLSQNNLKNVTVQFPLGIFTAVTGVSGSGKSTLIQKTLYPGLAHHLGIQTSSKHNKYTFVGDVKNIHHVVYMGQNALGKSTRSNLATYLQAYQHIRELFTQQPLAQQRNYTIAHFSFNTMGGRCEECTGDGKIKIDMQFMEDLFLTCESCNGKRFQQEILEVTYRGKSIIEVLDMSVEESLGFFREHPVITSKIKPLIDLGLASLRLGQPSSTFSSGEAQRVKIARYLDAKHYSSPTFFIFDEPSTGLHFHDIHHLIIALKRLTAQGHTVLVIEHNMEIIKCADWIIDLGPESGVHGGQITFTGTPEAMVKLENNHTARYLKKKLKKRLSG